MVEIERTAGQGVQIGRYTLRVLAVHPGEVVIALLDPERDCAACGQRPAEHRHCRVCRAEIILCPVCVAAGSCPRCGTAWE